MPRILMVTSEATPFVKTGGLGDVLGALTAEQRLEIGLTEGWVRLSVGLEGAGDLARDLDRALDGIPC